MNVLFTGPYVLIFGEAIRILFDVIRIEVIRYERDTNRIGKFLIEFFDG